MELTVRDVSNIMYTFGISYGEFDRNRVLYVELYNFFRLTERTFCIKFALFRQMEEHKDMFNRKGNYDFVLKLILDGELQRAENVINTTIREATVGQ